LVRFVSGYYCDCSFMWYSGIYTEKRKESVTYFSSLLFEGQS
jgi:hypothetical protein